MSKPPEELLTAALSLSEMERANFAVALLQSLDPKPDLSEDAALADEVKRRVESIDSGDVVLTPWNEVMSSLRQRRS